MKEEYKSRIIEVVNEIESEKILRMIYYFAYTVYREEKAGRPCDMAQERGRNYD